MIDIDTLKNRLSERKRNILGHETSFQSAVLIPLIMKNGEWHVLFEVRSHELKRQPGEICFPGGRVEKEDEDDAQAAIRETCEELQMPADQLQLLGPLDILVQTQSLVYPYVGMIKKEAAIIPNEEVEEIFTVPLQWLIEHEPEQHYLEMKIEPNQDFPFDLIPNGKNYNWRGHRKPEYFYLYENRVIWGLTARILLHFLKWI